MTHHNEPGEVDYARYAAAVRRRLGAIALAILAGAALGMTLPSGSSATDSLRLTAQPTSVVLAGRSQPIELRLEPTSIGVAATAVRDRMDEVLASVGGGDPPVIVLDANNSGVEVRATAPTAEGARRVGDAVAERLRQLMRTEVDARIDAIAQGLNASADVLQTQLDELGRVATTTSEVAAVTLVLQRAQLATDLAAIEGQIAGLQAARPAPQALLPIVERRTTVSTGRTARFGYALGGAVLGAAAAIVAVALLTAFDHRVRDRGDAERALGDGTVLAVVDSATAAGLVPAAAAARTAAARVGARDLWLVGLTSDTATLAADLQQALTALEPGATQGLRVHGRGPWASTRAEVLAGAQRPATVVLVCRVGADRTHELADAARELLVGGVDVAGAIVLAKRAGVDRRDA